jgi:glycosyltransferase involved in cell wall biosynthesis
MQKTAIVCVTNDLSTDQRVHKTCTTLQKCGYWVIEYGRLLPDSLSLERTYFTLRRKFWFNRGPLFYAEFNIRLFLYLMNAEVDLIFANDLDSLPACYLASRLRNKKLIFDAHELFPEVPELVHRPPIKAVWEKIEHLILPNLTHSLTVCRSISDYYKQKYNIQMTVVRNMPSYKSIPKNTNLSTPKTIIYQGALNKGRGLEMVLDAIPFVKNANLIIAGDGDIRSLLEKRVKSLKIEDRVLFLGKITGEKLLELTQSANIGLCLLENIGLNYYYSLPNRIFDYLHAGVPVLATNFPEIAAIVEAYKTGILIDHYEPAYLSEVINNMLENPLDTSHFDAISNELCWENEEKKLISLINQQ